VQEGRQGSIRKNVGRNLPFIKHRSMRFTQIEGSIRIHFKKHGILTGFTGC